MTLLKKLPNHTAIRIWLLAVSIGFGLTVFAYTAVQQSLRLDLNQPQLQMAEDAAQKLDQGASPQSVIPNTTIDESMSLSPFVTIVDSTIHVLASSGKIGTIVPLPPTSAFPDSQTRNTQWFTWQHDDNTVRDAVVIVPFDNGHRSGYVLVARSMRQVEGIISHITVLAGLTLIGVLVAATIIVFVI